MADQDRSVALGGVGMMLISAAIFGYFGFGMSWSHTSVINGKFLLFVALFDYTMKVAAVGFAASAALCLLNRTAGHVVFGLLGLASAVMFVIIALMDFADGQHTIMPGAPYLLVIFALWNGYSSWVGLREIMAMRSAQSARHAPVGNETRL